MHPTNWLIGELATVRPCMVTEEEIHRWGRQMIDRFITYSKTASWILKFSLTFLFYVFFTIVTVTPLRWQTYPCIPRHTCSGQQQCTARGRGSCGGKVGQCTGSAVQTHCLLFHWGCSAATSAVSVWRIRTLDVNACVYECVVWLAQAWCPCIYWPSSICVWNGKDGRQKQGYFITLLPAYFCESRWSTGMRIRLQGPWWPGWYTLGSEGPSQCTAAAGHPGCSRCHVRPLSWEYCRNTGWPSPADISLHPTLICNGPIVTIHSLAHSRERLTKQYERCSA